MAHRELLSFTCHKIQAPGVYTSSQQTHSVVRPILFGCTQLLVAMLQCSCKASKTLHAIFNQYFAWFIPDVRLVLFCFWLSGDQV